jgi:hypothetical protein
MKMEVGMTLNRNRYRVLTLHNVVAVLLLSFLSQISYADVECEAPSLHSLYDASDTILEVVSVNATMSWDEFRESVGANMSRTEGPDAYRKYREEFPFDTFTVSDVYKARDNPSGEIFVSGSEGAFSTNRRYVLFLNKGVPNNLNLDNLFIDYGCVLVDLDSSQLIWNEIYVDQEQFKAFMNQLVFRKNHGRFPESLPNLFQPADLEQSRLLPPY